MVTVYYDKNVNRVPIKSWAIPTKDKALEQAQNVSKLPFTYKHVALMPDCHQGYGVPIGCVFAAEGVVVPNAVGVDIGCGMCALKTPYKRGNFRRADLEEFSQMVRDLVPMGPNVHVRPQHTKLFSIVDIPRCRAFDINKAIYALGTLGGGNHFIELQVDEDDNVWIMIHTGSREVGYNVATYYNKEAKKRNADWHSSLDPAWDLAFLPMGYVDMHDYMYEMNVCVQFAKANRAAILKNVCIALDNVSNGHTPMNNVIDIAHNYASYEKHFGKTVVVHRKGATKATKYMTGIIPGSQGSSSYIVRGTGNQESFCSCSHGAGRVMSRTQARRELEELAHMNELGVVHDIESREDLDECSSAYKDIDVVMLMQEDLVEVVHRLRPIVSIKAKSGAYG